MKKQGTSDLEVENSEMGCETECERENQEDQEKQRQTLRNEAKSFFCGGKQVFSMFFFGGGLVHTNQKLRKKERKMITCHMLQTRVV